MLSMDNINDNKKMMEFYRTSDMLNLLYFFPELSPVRNITLVESVDEYLNNREFFDSFSQNRVDTIKGRMPVTVENAGGNAGFYETIKSVKEQDPNGALVLFNVEGPASKRYERFAGISVGVDLGEDVIIDAVSRGFDGREVSKSICCHERYYIPWFDLRKVCMGNFKDYQTFHVSDEEYLKTRLERINFLESVGVDREVLEQAIPSAYQDIPNFIWLSVIRNLIKKLEDNEYLLDSYGFDNFAISGHTEGDSFAPWQMFDKTRYTMAKQKVYVRK